MVTSEPSPDERRKKERKKHVIEGERSEENRISAVPDQRWTLRKGKISERKQTGKEILRKKEGKCAEAVLVW